jgi:hypothetical protein
MLQTPTLDSTEIIYLSELVMFLKNHGFYNPVNAAIALSKANNIEGIQNNIANIIVKLNSLETENLKPDKSEIEQLRQMIEEIKINLDLANPNFGKF